MYSRTERLARPHADLYVPSRTNTRILVIAELFKSTISHFSSQHTSWFTLFTFPFHPRVQFLQLAWKTSSLRSRMRVEALCALECPRKPYLSKGDATNITKAANLACAYVVPVSSNDTAGPPLSLRDVLNEDGSRRNVNL